MNTKSIYLFFLLCLFICVSCNDKEPSIVDKYPYYFAYFEGEVNGQYISLLNQSSYQCSIERGNFWIHDIEKELYGFYWKVPLKLVNFTYPYPELHISLIPLLKQEYHIKKGYLSTEEKESTVRIIREGSEITYHPLKTPFCLRVDTVFFQEDSEIPYIEGYMDGILYNTENSVDSIVIRNVYFGIH